MQRVRDFGALSSNWGVFIKLFPSRLRDPSEREKKMSNKCTVYIWSFLGIQKWMSSGASRGHIFMVFSLGHDSVVCTGRKICITPFPPVSQS